MNTKTLKGILYGVAIAIAFSATAATVYNYFPPPGMTYSPTTGFVVGTATGGAQGAGSINAQSMFVNGVAVATGGTVPTGATPTGSIGLTAVPGSATTFTRSDGTAALSQAISPTWTGTHLFSGAVITGVGTAGMSFGQVTGRANEIIVDTTGATNGKAWQWITANSGVDLILRTLDDTLGAQKNILDVTRSGSAVTNMAFANATDNPAIQFLGTGLMSISNGVVVGGATGGNKGAGTINAVGLYVGGVAVGTGGGTPGGASGNVQFNSGGTFGGDTGFAWDNTNKWVVLTNPTAGVTNLFECNSSNSANLRCFSQRIGSGPNGAYTLQPALDNFTLGNASLVITRDASANNTGIFLSNTTDNAPVTVQGTGGLQTAFLGVGRAPSSAQTKIVTDNGGSGDTEIVSQTTTAGDAYFRAVDLGGTNWSFGNQRSSSNFVIANNAGLGANNTFVMTTAGNTTFAGTGVFNGSTVRSNGSSGAVTFRVQNAGVDKGGFCVSASASACTSGDSVNDVTLDSFGGTLYLGANSGSSKQLSITSNGNVTVNNASSATTFTANGNLANTFTAVISNQAGTSVSRGLEVLAGTNTSDLNVAFNNAANTVNLMTIAGDGSVVVGNGVTGGNQGAGTINVGSGYAKGGSFVANGIYGANLIYAYITGNGSGCTLTHSVGFVAGCTRAATGRYNFTPIGGSWANYACTASPDVGGSQTSAAASGGNGGSGGVQVYASGTAADGNVSVICISQ